MGSLEIVIGDLTKQQVDAIVNAANEHLLPGGGVCGAIHAAAGPKLAEECAVIGHCPTGEARITRGFELPARWVIHAVAPVWRGGGFGELDLLAQAYRNALALASQPQCAIRSIAFPSLGTGIYAIPLEHAALVAIDEIDRGLRANATVGIVRMVCFSEPVYRAYVEAAQSIRE